MVLLTAAVGAVVAVRALCPWLPRATAHHAAAHAVTLGPVLGGQRAACSLEPAPPSVASGHKFAVVARNLLTPAEVTPTAEERKKEGKKE